jgi:osmotically inducible lipoprotein OsmB
LSLTKEIAMRSVIKTGLFVLMLAAAPLAAQAGTLEGVAIGAGTGAVIAGPPGAIVGGVIGGWLAARTSLDTAIATAGSTTMDIVTAHGAKR